MLTELIDALVWIMRSRRATPPRPPASRETPRLERFATFALLVLLLTTLGGIIHAR